MDVIIEETGEMKTLCVIDAKTGVDRAYRFINDTTGTSHWHKNEDGCYVIKYYEYEWWYNLLEKEQRVATMLSEHNALMTNDIFREIWHSETQALEHFTDIKLRILERVTAGKLTAKVVPLKINGQMRIGKNTCIVNYTEDEHTCFVDCEGTFILNTASTKYELPIGVASSYTHNNDYVTLDRELDSPINLSEAQAKVVYDTLFAAIKRELETDGHKGIKEYRLED